MAKKAKPRTAKKKAATKKVSRPAARSKKPAKKYDQTGAPWWKKFRPTEVDEAGA